MKDNFAEINIIPLVDIMLVLLVIVLMTANFMVHGTIGVSLPKSTQGEAAVGETIRIEIEESGTIYFEDASYANPEDLEQKLILQSKETPIVVYADKGLTLQPFITLLDTLKKFGFTKISIQTIK